MKQKMGSQNKEFKGKKDADPSHRGKSFRKKDSKDDKKTKKPKLTNKEKLRVKIGKPMKSHKHKKIKASAPLPGDIIKVNDKINRKPTNINEQEVPRTLSYLQFVTKSTKIKRKKKPNLPFEEKMEKGMSRAVEPGQKLTQFKNERDDMYAKRLERLTLEAIAEAKMKEKYELDLPEGIITDGKDKKDSDKPTRKDKKKERLKEKKEKLKEKKLIEIEDRKDDFGKDEVIFGEVNMAPPVLKKPQKTSDILSRNKPGGHRSLLLNEIMTQNIPGKTKSYARDIGKTVKRKHMSALDAQRSDQERERAVQLYREMKARKQKPFPSAVDDS